MASDLPPDILAAAEAELDRMSELSSAAFRAEHPSANGNYYAQYDYNGESDAFMSGVRWLWQQAIEYVYTDCVRLIKRHSSLEREVAALRACLLKNSIYVGDLAEADAIRREREGDAK